MSEPQPPATKSPEPVPANSGFACTHIRGLGGVTLEVRGRLDAQSAHRVEETLRHALRDARLVVLDLQAVDLIDPGSMRAIIRANGTAQAEGRRLVIICPPAPVDAALKINRTGGGLTLIDASAAALVDPQSIGVLELDIEFSADPGSPHFLVACRGEIDAATAPPLRDAIASLELGDVIVDMTGTSFVDSTGLSTLLNALRRLTRQEHRLVVVCPAGPVRDVLRLTALLETLNVVDDRTAAELVLSR